MLDAEIVELYWSRDESAIKYSDEKYGRYCRKIATSILYSDEDSEECVNDTYLNAWNSMPPSRPERLSTYLGKICRNLAINLYEKLTAAKRGGTETESCLDELEEILSSEHDVEETIDMQMLTQSINAFLETMNTDNRKIFVKRYWYMSSIKDIAKELSVSESKVKMSLLRTREKLKEYLLKEGYTL